MKEVNSPLVFPTHSTDASRVPFLILGIAMLPVLLIGLFIVDIGVILFGLFIVFALLLVAAPYTYGITDDRIEFRYWKWPARRLLFRQIDRLVPLYAYNDTHRPPYVHIAYQGRRKVYLCVKDQGLFIEQVLQRSPHLKKYGYEWRRGFGIGDPEEPALSQ